MPTATSTLTAPSTFPVSIPLKGIPHSPETSSPNSTTLTTLRSLYNRAARAFLLRDVPLAHSLLSSAFSILKPPSSFALDSFAIHRRKWDILRITLETTLYASPPQSTELEILPASLRANLTLSSQYLVNSLYTRSLDLFTPSCSFGKANAAFLPSQVLVTLVLSSLKLDCVDVGRWMVEEWLAQRGESEDSPLNGDGDGYEKVLEMYCLHVLPKLQQWEYATDFLQYEGELTHDRRDHLKASLQKLRSETLATPRSPSPPPFITHTSASPRAASPAPSAASSSSSLSTASARTAVPRTPRPVDSFTSYAQANTMSSGGVGLLSPATSASSTSLASISTITHHSSPNTTSNMVAHKPTRVSNLTSKTSDQSPSPVPRGPLASVVRSHSTAHPPSTLALIRASLGPYLTTSKLTTVILLFIVLPLVSFLLRRRRRRQLVGKTVATNTAEQVRRRLKATGTDIGGQKIVSRIFWEVVRVVGDAIRMGGSGLV